jgi:hypothetical protein
VLANFKKKDNGSNNVSNGQITVKEDPDPKYMRTVINKKNLLDFLSHKYKSDFFIFINELDIKNDLSDYTAVGTNTYQREMKVHYTIFDSRGSMIRGGVAIANFPCENINSGLPQPKLVKEEVK